MYLLLNCLEVEVWEDQVVLAFAVNARSVLVSHLARSEPCILVGGHVCAAMSRLSTIEHV
jgi:hypothetical protein